MTNLKLPIIATTALFGLTLVAPVTTTAQAATWHRGTPKALRGKWRIEGVSTGILHLRLTKSHVYFYSMGPLYYLKNVKYKKVGSHAYKVRGYEYTHNLEKNTLSFRTKGSKAFQFKGIYPTDTWLDFSRR